MGLRNWLYDKSLLRAQKVETIVVSIGNLTVGGTGKTPVTLALMERLQERGFSFGVVSRGYHRSTKGLRVVKLEPRSAQQYGDEPTLIKTTFPEAPVVVCEKRALAAKALLEKQKVDVILCDDGFQHRRLHRDLNILLIDATEETANYRLLPVGRARESLLPALRRADIFIVTKANLVSEEKLADVMHWLQSKAGGKPIIKGKYVLNGLSSLTGKSEQELKDPVYLVSGIAKPKALEQTLAGRVKVVKHKVFSDHHRYTDLEIEAMLDEASHLQARWLLTTAKDSTKLSGFKRLKDRLWVTDLRVQFEGDAGALDEAFDRLARPNS
jgi:tetraacyldisaccharide 4'-kinase